MPTFSYKARTSQGEVINGTQEAPTQDDAARTLRDQGYWVTELQLQRGRSSSRSTDDAATVIPTEDFILGEAHPKVLALFYRQMAASLHAGIGISRCIELASIGTGGRLKRALDVVMAQTQTGTSLAEAMAPRKELFGKAAWALIRAGEASGRLENVLTASADHYERRWRLQQLVRRAMVYPAFLLLALIFIPLLPIAIIQGPAAAAKALLLQLGSLSLILIGLLAFKVLLRFEKPGFVWDSLLYRLPVIGGFVKKAAAARFLRTFADLYEVGIGPLSALDISAETCGNRYVSEKLRPAKSALEAGEPLSSALGRTGVLPTVAVQMLVTGETSGSVGTLLTKVADYLESEVETGTDMFMKALPVLLWAAIAIPIALTIIRFWSGMAGGYSP